MKRHITALIIAELLIRHLYVVKCIRKAVMRILHLNGFMVFLLSLNRFISCKRTSNMAELLVGLAKGLPFQGFIGARRITLTPRSHPY
jgi:hypothetical protein